MKWHFTIRRKSSLVAALAGIQEEVVVLLDLPVLIGNKVARQTAKHQAGTEVLIGGLVPGLHGQISAAVDLLQIRHLRDEIALLLALSGSFAVGVFESFVLQVR
jgi:hypothetical protein